MAILKFSVFRYPRPPATEPETPIWPMQAGNSWEYLDIASGKISQSEPFRDTTVAGITGCFSGQHTAGEALELLWNDKQGNAVYALIQDGKVLVSNAFIKKHVQKGDTYKAKTAVFTNGDYVHPSIEEREITCVATDTLIAVPAGDFRCTAYQYCVLFTDDHKPIHIFTLYMAVGVGRVKSVHHEYVYDYGGTLNRIAVFETVLTAYTVK